MLFFRVAVITGSLAIGSSVAPAQDARGRMIGVLSDPGGVSMAGVEIQLTGLDVRPTYAVRTDREGRFEFPKLVPGAYRVEVRQSAVVATPDIIRVAAGEPLRTEIRTALKAQIGLSLTVASVEALRRWAAGGPPPAAALEWDCSVNGQRCAAPARDSEALVPPPLGDVMVNALIALGRDTGIVEISGLIAADGGGFMSGLSVNSATSPELAAAVLLEVGRMRWEPARLRGVAVNTSVTMDIRFDRK